MAGKKQPPRENPECKQCQVALTDDNWTTSMQKYRRYVCKVCWAARQKSYAKADPDTNKKKRVLNKRREDSWSDERRQLEKDKRKDRYLQKTYGICLEDYNRMLTEQGKACKICGTTEPGSKGVFAVDHCHSGGHVRGLLCNNCNMMLGLVYDNTKVLMNAIKYLEDNK